MLRYQPKLDLENNTINAAEALVRWMHPEKGLIPPGDFIELAEQTGLNMWLSMYRLADIRNTGFSQFVLKSINRYKVAPEPFNAMQATAIAGRQHIVPDPAGAIGVVTLITGPK